MTIGLMGDFVDDLKREAGVLATGGVVGLTVDAVRQREKAQELAAQLPGAGNGATGGETLVGRLVNRPDFFFWGTMAAAGAFGWWWFKGRKRGRGRRRR